MHQNFVPPTITIMECPVTEKRFLQHGPEQYQTAEDESYAGGSDLKWFSNTTSHIRRIHHPDQMPTGHQNNCYCCRL